MTTHDARAFLDVSLADAKGGVRRTAEEVGVPVEETAGGLFLRLRSGTLRVSGADGRTTLEIAAPEASGLQMLRDMVAERIGALGIGLSWEGALAGRLPGNVSLARIETVERISPSYIRIRMTGPALARFARFALHFRLLLGPEGAPWPATDEGGVTLWPDGIGAWHRPVYTTREIEPLGGEAARITFDVFRHEGGRTTGWAERVRPGAEIAISGPSGGDRPAAPWMALIGDETAVPVIARILAEADPAMQGTATLFVPEAGDVQHLAAPAGVALCWIRRDEPASALDALRALAIPGRDRFVFFAAERREAFAARDLLRERGLARGEFFASSYWTAGA